MTAQGYDAKLTILETVDYAIPVGDLFILVGQAYNDESKRRRLAGAFDNDRMARIASDLSTMANLLKVDLDKYRIRK